MNSRTWSREPLCALSRSDGHWQPGSRSPGLVRDALSHFSWVSGLDWSPDSSRLTLAARIGDTERLGVYIAELDGGEPRRLTDGDVVSWSPDGQRIAFAR